MTEEYKGLVDELNSPSQAYTVNRHLENGDLMAALLVAAMPERIFERPDEQMRAAFIVGMAAAMYYRKN